MKLTTPKAILIGSALIASAILFRLETSLFPIQEARAEVAGMDSYDLQYDYDFTDAVESIIENCDVSRYVDGNLYLYRSDIDC